MSEKIFKLDSNHKKLIAYVGPVTEIVKIPDGIEEIGEEAFNPYFLDCIEDKNKMIEKIIVP